MKGTACASVSNHSTYKYKGFCVTLNILKETLCRMAFFFYLYKAEGDLIICIMGTLGCINDMLRRDKENRELRHRSRERMKDTQLRLTQVRREEANPRLTASQLEEIISETRHKEVADRNRLFRGKMLFYGCICLILLISGLLWLLLT